MDVSLLARIKRLRYEVDVTASKRLFVWRPRAGRQEPTDRCERMIREGFADNQPPVRTQDSANLCQSYGQVQMMKYRKPHNHIDRSGANGKPMSISNHELLARSRTPTFRLENPVLRYVERYQASRIALVQFIRYARLTGTAPQVKDIESGHVIQAG
jgi:hypothetical protein